MKSTISKSTRPFGLRCLGVALIAIGGVLAGGQPAFAANNCIQDVWKAHGNSQNLTCTANDVSLSSVTNICVDDGMGGCKAENTCISGTMVTFTADFSMPLTAQARYDLGLYLATDGGGTDGAKTGLCFDSTIIQGMNALNYLDLDGDTCGDIDDTHSPQVIRQSITTQCTPFSNTDNHLKIPWCTSWRQPGANEVCSAGTSPPTEPNMFDAFPGSPSKCNCGTLAIDITVENPTGALIKTATEAYVKYHVQLDNSGANFPLTVSTLCDDKAGDITPNGTSSPACPVAQSGYVLQSTTCPDLPTNVAAGGSLECDFTVKVPSSANSQTNTVSADVSNQGGSDTFQGSKTVIVNLNP